jgi:predicted phage tail protein
MNPKNWARRAVVSVAVATILGAAGSAEAGTVVPTQAPRSATLSLTATVATAPRSPVARPRAAAISLAWRAPSRRGGARVDKYRVQRATSATGPWRTVATPTVRRYRVTGLRNGTRYYLRVAAHNSAGWSRPSRIVNAVPRTVPVAPMSPTAVPGNTTVKLAWLAPGDNGGAAVDAYRVQRAASATGPWTTIATPTTRSHTVVGLTNGTRYYFRVAAHNPAGWGPPSTVVNASPRTVPSAPLAPWAGRANAAVGLVWSAPSGTGGAAVDKYEVQQALSANGPWASVGTTGELSYVVNDLINGIRFHYRIRAHNPAGWGPFSSVVSAVPITVPTEPLNCSANQWLATDTFLAGWQTPSSNGGAPIEWYRFELWQNGVLQHYWVVPPIAGYQQALSRQLPADGGYEARVAALNAAGQGPWCTAYLYMSP